MTRNGANDHLGDSLPAMFGAYAPPTQSTFDQNGLFSPHALGSSTWGNAPLNAGNFVVLWFFFLNKF